MIRILVPAEAPAWLYDYTRSVEQAIRDASNVGFVVTATGTGASQDITLPVAALQASDVQVFEAGALRQGDYTISGNTLTLTATASAALVVLQR